MSWNNKLFAYKGKSLFYKNLLEGNILYVKDLFDEHGLFKNIQCFDGAIQTKTNWMITNGSTIEKFEYKRSNKINVHTLYTSLHCLASYIHKMG